MLLKSMSKAAGASRRALPTKNTQWHETVPQRTLLASAVASCLMLGAPVAFGQSGSANLRGQVTTDAAPAANTDVVATNVATGAVRRTRTSADGTYVLVGLPPGTYTVEAGGVMNVVTLSVASNATLNLRPGTGDAESIENITVTGYRRSAPDVLTSEVGSTISPRLIQQLPQATRNFL
jgi:hypothetical protein